MSKQPSPEQTIETRLASLDKLQNVLMHPDYRELYLRLSEDVADLQQAMDNAGSWEAFVAARAVKSYVVERLLNLRDLVAAEKAELEERQAAIGQPAPPPDYELY